MPEKKRSTHYALMTYVHRNPVAGMEPHTHFRIYNKTDNYYHDVRLAGGKATYGSGWDLYEFTILCDDQPKPVLEKMLQLARDRD